MVDDETATVLALDAGSLEPVQSFRHVGAPQALFARGTQAWYICAARVELPGRGRPSGPGIQLGPAGPRWICSGWTPPPGPPNGSVA